ncbi:hypothetical protein CFI00_01020 [Nocardioides sp. S5]|uniref:hypothetical protein n=1 Tax=Nocardioides sp. S5 TaxID=2017486 RepID=UPI001A8D22EE|nr:hypothetical protein [Nocardioides sp. S5]QSR29102.1 hypothetical protein CFI00_01020 [Nocardioides sp. S5]
MWKDLASVGVALLGLGVAAGLFARRTTRRTAAMMSQAELWAQLPRGPGKAALRMYLDERTVKLVADLRHTDTDWTERAFRWFDNIMWTGLALIAAGYALHIPDSEAIETTGSLIIALGVVLVGFAVLLAVAATSTIALRWSRKRRP